jgi:hypothetical protein
MQRLLVRRGLSALAATTFGMLGLAGLANAGTFTVSDSGLQTASQLHVGSGLTTPSAASSMGRRPVVSSSQRTPLASASAVRTCRPRYFGLFDFRKGQEYVVDLSVRNMTCREAIQALHNADLVGWPPNLRTRGFKCQILTGGGGGATDRCVHNRPYKAFRVSIGT